MLLPLLLAGLLCGGCQMPRGAATAPDRAFLHASLVELAQDVSTADAKPRVYKTHLLGWVPEEFWLTVFPPYVKHDRLLSQGKVLLVPDAKLIAEDASENQGVRDEAAFFYGYFDEPWYLRWLAGKTYPTEPMQFELYKILDRILPSLPHEISYPHYDLTHEWLTRQIATYATFDAVVLARLDAIMILDLPPQIQGLQEQDRRLVKWFNRLNDVDIDEWLEVHAPKSLEYRQRTIRETGVDPLTAYAVAGNASDEGRRKILFRALPATEAQACLDLLNVVFPKNIDDRRKRPPQSDANWRERACAWYWAHRKEFTYDPALRRFVLPSETSQGK
jgi:hypothetical protein